MQANQMQYTGSLEDVQKLKQLKQMQHSLQAQKKDHHPENLDNSSIEGRRFNHSESHHASTRNPAMHS
jgi:hypothetical protein